MVGIFYAKNELRKELHILRKFDIPVWEKMTLTPEEAAAYSNIGVNKIRSMADEPQCSFVVFVGNRKLIKRKEFEKYITSRNSI